MNLKNRLKKLEREHSFEPQIMVVRFGNEINRLSCGGEKFYRDEGETEEDFIKRIKGIVEERPVRSLLTILVGNF